MEAAAIWPWVLPVVLVLMIVNSAALLPGWGLACVTLTTSLAHLAAVKLVVARALGRAAALAAAIGREEAARQR